MTFFMVSGQNEEKLETAIKTHHPENARRIGNGQWIISATGTTTKELSDKLGLSEGLAGKVLVTSFASYYGWHDPDLWEWLSSRSKPVG